VIGQVGYMLLGMGIGLYFIERKPALGMAGLMACVFHMINHSLYKSCLFLGAGTVQYRTGERNLSALGGLGHAMPVTAACALCASLAIAGVPPMNGFSSKWLMYATAIVGGREFPVFVFLGVVAMFVSLVTLASFLKYLGAAFLGPRTEREGLREAPASMVVPQALLALGCIAFGIAPAVPLRFVHQALAGMMPGGDLPAMASMLGGQQMQVRIGTLGVASWFPALIAALLALMALVAFWLQRSGKAGVRNVPVWTCGETHESRLARYPGSSLYLPFKHVFERMYPSGRLRPVRFPAVIGRVLEMDRWIYDPVLRLFLGVVGMSKRTHTGVPHLYLSWIVLGAVVMVCVVMAVSR
jgi:hydrogenase-4 component B